MKASDLIDTDICGPDGRPAGVVIDVRARVEADGTLVVDGLVVARRRLRLFGYERRGETGPLPLAWFERLLHRGTCYASTSEFEVDASGRPRLLVERERLPHIGEI
jgi:hypothetical protein